MKKVFSLILVLVILFTFNGCAYDAFGHETYTDVTDYTSAFELPEIRYYNARDELFPRDVSNLNVDSFYFEWELGIVGSADVETLLSVTYEQDVFSTEIARLQSLVNGEVVYDEERFSLPAYVTVLGALETSVYALVDTDNLKIHYIYLQLLDKARIDIPNDFLPSGYYGYGDILGEKVDVYEYIDL